MNGVVPTVTLMSLAVTLLLGSKYENNAYKNTVFCRPI